MIGTAPLWGTHIYYVNIKLMKHFSVRFEAQLMRGLFFISSRTWEFLGECDIPKIDKERKQPPRIPQPIPWVPRGRHPNHPSPSPFFRGLRVPGDAFQISTIEAHDAMVKFGSMPQRLETAGRLGPETMISGLIATSREKDRYGWCFFGEYEWVKIVGGCWVLVGSQTTTIHQKTNLSDVSSKGVRLALWHKSTSSVCIYMYIHTWIHTLQHIHKV